MGLRGPGAKPKSRTPAKKQAPKKRAPDSSSSSRFERVAAFIETLPITSGMLAGTLFKLADWELEILRAIYRIDAKGHRLIRQALLTFPRKQGKTAIAAAIGVTHLCGPEAEPRGQVLSAAAERGQAAIIYAEMKAMIEGVPELDERIIAREWNKSLTDRETGSTYQALSADVQSKHGFSASCWIYDELAQAPNRKLYDVLMTSTAARKEPLGIVISTQSSDPHSIMTELVDYGTKVRDGVLKDDHFLPVIYAAPEDADPWDEKVWHACNPALASGFKSLEQMRIEAMQAQRIPAREPAFRLLHLNQRIVLDARFIPKAEWDACGDDVDREKLRGRPCYAGLDLSSTTDLTALVLYFPEDGGAVLPFFWAPKDRLEEREHTDRVPYQQWHQAGLLEAPAGRAIDRAAIVKRLAEIASEFDVLGVAYDRWRLEDLKKLLADEGIDVVLSPWGQGFKDMGPAVDALEAAILDRKIRHGAHPILTWNASNCVVEIDPAGSRKLDKSKSRERIDGMVALAMAIGLAARAPKKTEFVVPVSLAI